MTRDVFEWRRAFRLTALQAKLLIALVDSRRLTMENIEFDLGIATDAKVAIHRLRRRLSPYQVKIESIRDGGYWLTDAEREKVLGILQKSLAPLASAA
jgi:hypothetical protein